MKGQLPFLTGTRAFGPARQDSDFDIVMFYYEAGRLRGVLELLGIEVKEPNKLINPVYAGYEFTISGHVINVIEVTSEDEYENWKFATEQMMHRRPYHNREERINVFTKLRERYYDITR